MGEPAFSLSREGREIVIRISDDLFDENTLTRLLDRIELEAIAKQSRLTEEDAHALADEVDRAVWERVKHLAGGR